MGAGDGFAVGVVSALLEGRRVPDAVRRGAWIGARAVQVLGDTEGLPTRAATRRGGPVSSRKNVLVFRELPDDQLARLQARCTTSTVANPRIAAAAARPSRRRCRTAHGLIGSSYPIDAALLDARAAARGDLQRLGRRRQLRAGRRCTRAASCCATRPACSTETMADTVFALLMATSRRVVELSNLVREGRWTQNIGEDLFGFDVHGKTLGMLGFGRIGQAMARRAALGFGMPVLYHARRPVDLAAQAPELQGRAMHTPLDALLAQCRHRRRDAAADRTARAA